uniref:ADF-H domain-containing protein n=1 Tax=Compsopogon caeruleus TaxID=31354 RepID=A0A7S1XF39_9RHOD|mmetsp:Transcript_2468/g.4275  ORF Transcript_2468/g.4275 Transcript_2468/m.4275 type:complete len:147 (+) Transcript_2468:138-578(+)
MASGVGVDQQCIVDTQHLVKERKYRAVILKINDSMTLVEVEKTFPVAHGDAKTHYMEVAKTLPEDDCRYLVYDFEYEMQGINKNKVVFLLWSPECSKVKSKMIYASSQEGVVNALQGISRQLQATDVDELDYAHIAKHLKQHTASY